MADLNEFYEKLLQEATASIGSTIVVSPEEKDEIKLAKLYESMIKSQQEAQLAKDRLEFEKVKFEREMKLKEKQFKFDKEMRTSELELKEALNMLEEKKIEASERIAKLNADNDKANRRRDYILGFTKIGSYLTMGAADMVNTYIDDGRTPKLFTKSMDNIIK